MNFDKWLLEQLFVAFKEARRGKLSTVDEFKFEVFYMETLVELRNEIANRTYKPMRSIAFINHNPKDREIFAASFPDRVVHHFVIDMIEGWWERRLQPFSYSCRKGRGTDYAIRDAYAKMRKVSDNFHNETFVVQLDLDSYFCSIPRELLFERIKWGLDLQFQDQTTEFSKKLYETLLFLVHEIIMDDPVEGVTIKGSWREWLDYPKHKSLLVQRPEVGIVIGNLTSQVFSNAYLDQLDRFCFFDLELKNIGRYVDDLYIVLRANEVGDFFDKKMPQIRERLAQMGLRLNESKTRCQNINKSWEFVGARLAPYRVTPSKRMIKGLSKTIPQVVSGQKDLECLVSYLGRFNHFDCQNLLEELFNKNGLDYVKDPFLGPNSLYYTSPKLYKHRKFWP